MKLKTLHENTLAKPEISIESGVITLGFSEPVPYDHYYAKNGTMEVGILRGYRIDAGSDIEIIFVKNLDDNYQFDFNIWDKNDKKKEIEDWEAGDDELEWINFALSTTIASLRKIVDTSVILKIQNYFKQQL